MDVEGRLSAGGSAPADQPAAVQVRAEGLRPVRNGRAVLRRAEGNPQHRARLADADPAAGRLAPPCPFEHSGAVLRKRSSSSLDTGSHCIHAGDSLHPDHGEAGWIDLEKRRQLSGPPRRLSGEARRRRRPVALPVGRTRAAKFLLIARFGAKVRARRPEARNCRAGLPTDARRRGPGADSGRERAGVWRARRSASAGRQTAPPAAA